MSTTDLNTRTEHEWSVQNVDLKLEVVVIPVSDVDRSKAFYASLGWRLDADFSFDNGFRVVQFTPPGSGASVQFGTNISTAAPGSAQGLYLVVSDIEAARDELAARGADVIARSSIPAAPGGQFEPAGRALAPPGWTSTTRATDRSQPFAIPTATRGCCRRSRRGFPAEHPTTPRRIASIADLAGRDATRIGRARRSTKPASARPTPNWPDWYAAYMVAEQAGTPLPE